MNFQLSLDAEPASSAYPAEPLPVDPDTPLRDVLALLKAQASSCVLVCREGVLEGIFTERDALRLMASGADLTTQIAQVMIPRPTTIRSDATVGDAIRTMSQGGYRRVPVIDDRGCPTGVVGVAGVVRYLVEHFPEAIYNLPPEPDQLTKEREGA